MEQKKTEKLKFSGYQIFVVIILAILQFTIVLDFSIISPLGDMMMKKLSIDPSQFGLLVSCYAFGAGIAGFLATGFADKFDRKKFLMFFYTGFIIGTFLCGFAHSYHTLMIARCITGLFGGVIGSISLAIVSDLFAMQQRGRVMGYIQMAFAGSQVLGIPLGIVLANKWGWNSTFIAIAIVAAIIYIVVAVKLKPLNNHLKLQSERNLFRHYWAILSNKNHLTGFSLIVFTSLGGSMLMPFSSSFLINNVGITQMQLPIIFIFTGIATLIIMPLVGKLSDIIDKFKLFVMGSVISIVITIIYTGLTPTPLWIVVVINIILFTGISSRMIPASALNTAVPDIKNRGAYMSLCSSLQQMSNGIAAMIAGFIIIQPTKSSPIEHYNILGYIVAAFCLVCIFLLYRVSRVVKAKQEYN